MKGFDKNGSYLATKIIGKNNPKAEAIKADRAEYERIYGEKAANTMSIRDRLRQKEQIVNSKSFTLKNFDCQLLEIAYRINLDSNQ